MGGNLIFLSIFIIVILFIAYFFNKYSEPFVNPVVVSNLSLNPDEIFLVATNPASFNIKNSPDSFEYNTGVRFNDALRACQLVGPGVTLANLSTLVTSPSKLSLNVAIDLSANWCAAGWVAESAQNGLAYFPMTNFTSFKCTLRASEKRVLTTTPGPGQFFLPTSAYGPNRTYNYGIYNPGTDGQAFAICVGPKPPLPTAKINPFNNDSYSMYNSALMTYLETGVDSSNPYNNDIFPVAFTSAQAYTALKNTTPPYNVAAARSTLVANYSADTNSRTSNALNSALQALEDPTTALNWSTNSYTETCNTLSTIYSRMDSSLVSLSTIFSDLSGTVSSIISAKQENGILQTTIANICLGPQATSTAITAACSRLLSLDYDILYRNKSIDEYTQSNTITDLESLNYALRIRECEIQQSLGSLQEILRTMNCSNDTLSRLTTKYKNNIVTIDSAKNITTPISCTTYFNKDGSFSENPTKYSAPSGTYKDTDGTIKTNTSAFKIGRDIQYNPVDNLKISLQQISPFFTGNQYQSLLSDVLNQLSVTLRTVPQDYSNLQTTAKNTNENMGLVEKLFSLL